MRYWIVLLLCAVSTTTHADWALVKDASSLSYVSIKKNEIGETNYFRQFDATIQKNGELRMEVNLESVDTRYKIRDERMRGLFFETHLFPKATISGKVPLNKVETMKAGSVEKVTVEVTLDLHGNKDKVTADLRLVRMDNHRFMAITETPILLNVQAFDLTDGVQRLMDAVQLESITWVVPVAFVLVFEN